MGMCIYYNNLHVYSYNINEIGTEKNITEKSKYRKIKTMQFTYMHESTTNLFLPL